MDQKKDAQVQEIIMHLAGEFLTREAGRQSLITVTRADTSADLKNTTIFISVFPTTAEATALAFCKRERSAFRDYMKAKSALNFLPTIDFAIDIGEKNRQHIDDLLRQ